jgi:hypothetical protein
MASLSFRSSSDPDAVMFTFDVVEPWMHESCAIYPSLDAKSIIQGINIEISHSTYICVTGPARNT